MIPFAEAVIYWSIFTMPNESHKLIHSAKIQDILDLTLNVHNDNR